MWIDRVLVDSIVWMLESWFSTYAVGCCNICFTKMVLQSVLQCNGYLLLRIYVAQWNSEEWVNWHAGILPPMGMLFPSVCCKMQCAYSASIDTLFYIWLDRISRYYCVDTLWCWNWGSQHIAYRGWDLRRCYCVDTLWYWNGTYKTSTVAIPILKNDPLVNVATQRVFTLVNLRMGGRSCKQWKMWQPCAFHTQPL